MPVTFGFTFRWLIFDPDGGVLFLALYGQLSSR
jgi:hypothetical protein